MKISIVIPVFNQGDYLEDAIESAYNQSVPVHEIIIINDGSTDNSKKIAERYMFKDFPQIASPVRVINQVNKGLASARNTGIMASTGDYILFLDSDDVLIENAIESFTRNIAGNNFDVLAPSFKEFGKSDREVILQSFTLEELKIANRLPYFCCFKRSLLVECGGYSPRMNWGFEDYHLWFDLWNRNVNFCILQEILVKYRVRDNSMIHTSNQHAPELHAQIMKDFPNLF